jgi:DNA-binding NtrC family response regulator
MKPIKVLLVDDDEDFVTTVSDRIGEYKFESDTALSGEQAIELVAGQVPDVMVVDLKMPRLDGLELLRQVKKKHPDIQVIILTGHGSTQDRLAAISLGAFAFMEKPVDFDELVRTIRAAYQKRDCRW